MNKPALLPLNLLFFCSSSQTQMETESSLEKKEELSQDELLLMKKVVILFVKGGLLVFVALAILHVVLRIPILPVWVGCLTLGLVGTLVSFYLLFVIIAMGFTGCFILFTSPCEFKPFCLLFFLMDLLPSYALFLLAPGVYQEYFRVVTVFPK